VYRNFPKSQEAYAAEMTMHINNNFVVEGEYWTTNRLTEELYLHLMKVTEKDGPHLMKYREQAKYLMYQIPVYRPTPSFTINVQDLTEKLKSELESLDYESLNDVLKEGIGRIFESINERYYLLSVKRLLKWKLVK
jgi:hypothetical protein